MLLMEFGALVFMLKVQVWHMTMIFWLLFYTELGKISHPAEWFETNTPTEPPIWPFLFPLAPQENMGLKCSWSF